MNRQFFVNVAERVGFTFVEVFFGVLTAGGVAIVGVIRVPWLAALDQGAFAAVIALVTGLVAAQVLIANPLLDLLWRSVVTFGQSLAATAAASGATHSIVHFHWSSACYVAFLAAGAAAVKAMAGFLSSKTKGASVFVLAPGKRHLLTRNAA